MTIFIFFSKLINIKSNLNKLFAFSLPFTLGNANAQVQRTNNKAKVYSVIVASIYQSDDAIENQCLYIHSSIIVK